MKTNNEEFLAKMKEEAICRLEKVGVDKNVIVAMKNSTKMDTIFVSEVFTASGNLVERLVEHKIDDFPEQVQTVLKNKEGKWDCLPYFGINHGGLCILYVSSNEEEWEFDRDYLDKNYQIAYVYNELYPDCSEFGSIVFEKSPRGGLIRIG